MLGVRTRKKTVSGRSSKADLLLDRLPLLTAARTCRVGLYGSLAFGLAQDMLGLARGRKLGYIDFLLGRRHGSPTTDD